MFARGTARTIGEDAYKTMSAKVFPPCKAWSQLKKTLRDKESWDFWSIILLLEKDDGKDKVKLTEDYYESILKYYCAGRKDKNETFVLMEETAKHYDVYDLFLQTFKAAYEKDSGKLSPGVINLTVKSTKDEVLRDDYLKHLSAIRESLEAISPEFYCQRNNPMSSGEKVYSDKFEYELYHQLRQHNVLLSKDHLLVKTKGDNLVTDLLKLSRYYKARVNSNYEITLPRLIYSKDLVDSIRHIPLKYRVGLYHVAQKTDVVCFYLPNEQVEFNGTKMVFVCKTLGEILKIVERTKKKQNEETL